jgi:hypothetical protein
LDSGALQEQITAVLSSDSNGECQHWAYMCQCSLLTTIRRRATDDARRHRWLWGARHGGRPHLPP